MPPVPTRAMGLRFSARPIIVSISSSRPKQALGGGGGNSPGVTVCRHGTIGASEIVDIPRVCDMSASLPTDGVSHSPDHAGHHPDLPTSYDEYPQP